MVAAPGRRVDPAELSDEDVLGHWERVLPAYADPQRKLSPRVGELTAAGVPDERPHRIPELFSALLDKTDVLFVEEPDGLRPEEFARFRQLGSALATRCDVLAHSGIAPTVDHSDLHDGNVFVQDGSYAVFDWGDASLTHPFASLLVTMSALGARRGVSSDAPVLSGSAMRTRTMDRHTPGPSSWSWPPTRSPWPPSTGRCHGSER